MKKNDSSPEWRKTKAILKIASGIGIVSFVLYIISEGFSLEIIKNGLLLGFFAIVFIVYFGCGLFTRNDQHKEQINKILN